jgi:TetR/AcrR family transcriptional regulator, transcriptional repressor for nem operon
MGRKSENGGAILEAAVHTFWTKGYEGVGVNEICENAGINKGTLYHFYEDKEALILSVIEKNSAFVADFIRGHGHLPPLERVLAYFDMMRETQKAEFKASGHLAGCPFGNLGVEMGTRNEKVRKSINKWFNSMVDFLSVAITECKNSSHSSVVLADEIFTYWQGAILRSKTANTLAHIDAAREYTVRVFNGLKKG